jgi:flagellar biosynthetic protein FliR
VTGLETIAVTWLLALLRFVPIFAIPALTPFSWSPIYVRMVLPMAIAWLVAGTLAPVAAPTNLAMAAIGELALGASLSLAVVLPMTALGTSAKLVDMQAGISSASLFNPALQTNDSLVGTIFSLAGTEIFFALGFDLLVVRALATSTAIVPVGMAMRTPDIDALFGMLGSQFVLGLMVALPVVFGLFAVDIAVAYASRSMPQANIYFLTLPLKVGVALILLAASLQMAPTLVGRLFADALARSRQMVGA